MAILFYLIAVFIVWALVHGGNGPKITTVICLLAVVSYGEYVRPVRPKLARALDRAHVERILNKHAVNKASVVGLRHDTWFPKMEYQKGEFVNFEKSVWVCVQGHTSQLGWEPPNVPALWKLFRTPDETIEDIPEWRQPLGAHDAYAKGDRVRFDGKTYESLLDGNVWSPTAHPAGWKEIKL